MRHALFAAALAGLTVSTLQARADDRLAQTRIPSGWKVEIAASEPMVVNPVTMTFGDDGRLYVIEWKEGREPNDHIKVLTDDNGDGIFDRAEMFMDKLDLPAGILFWDGWVYLTLEHDIVRFRDADGDGKYEVRETIATGFGNDNSHHRVSGLILGPDGYLYMTTGDSDAHARGSDGSKADVLRCGGVFRCKPDGSKMENVAYGMRNPWGNVAFDDGFRIFHTDNDNEGSPGFTGCRLLHVVEGGDYGWRLREGARCCAPDFERATWNGGRAGRLGWITETGRGAPAGLAVLNSAAFPESQRNLLVYPDVFRKLVRAYTLKEEGATYKVGKEVELLASDEGLFRPTDAEVSPDGSLYILDWRTDSGGAGRLSGNGTTGRIFRLTWNGTAEEPARKTFAANRFFSLRTAESAKLVEALSDADYGMRRAASLELMRRGASKLPLEALSKLFTAKESSPFARLHTLGLLFATIPTRPEFQVALEAGMVDTDPSVRRYAVELAGRLKGVDVVPGRRLAALALKATAESEPPQIRRAGCVAMGAFGSLDKKVNVSDRVSSGALASELLRIGASESIQNDLFLLDGITRGLERIGPAGLAAVVQALGSKDQALAKAALFALQGWRTDEGLTVVLDEATTDAPLSSESRAGLFRNLREMVVNVPATPVANWLANRSEAGAEPRVEAIRLLNAMHQKALLAAGPVLAGLLKDKDLAVRLAAIALSREVRTDDAKQVLFAIVESSDRTGEERGAALASLRAYPKIDLNPLSKKLVAEKNLDTNLRLELFRTLGATDLKSAIPLATPYLTDANRELRHEAITILGRRADSALVVAKNYETGKIPPEDLTFVIEAIRPHATPELQAILRELLKKTVIKAPEGTEANRFRMFVAREGNPERGRALYLDAKKGGCATCHRLEGVGGAVGPDLTRVWETLSFVKRVESILEPSKEIKEGFVTYKVATKDGQVVTGLLLADTPEGVTLKNAEGKEVRVAAADIEEKATDKTSLMPVGVVGHLSLNELADLLSFLGDRKAQESLRTTKP